MLVLGRCYHFARAESTYPLHKSLLQSCAVARAELQAYMYAQADAHGVFVQWQEWLSIHLGKTETSVVDVAGIVAKLGLGQPDLP